MAQPRPVEEKWPSPRRAPILRSAMTDASSQCRHCLAPTRPGEVFCCAGCEAVHAAVQGDGLQDYYKLRAVDREALSGVPARPGRGGGHGYLDSDRYRQERCTPVTWRGPDGAPVEGIETSWMVGGMTCVACAWLIEQVGEKTEGVVELSVDPMQRRLRLRAENTASLTRLADEIARFGYAVALPGEGEDEAVAYRRDLAQLAIAGALAANTMLLTLPFYFGLHDAGPAALFGWVSLLLATLCLAWPARSFFQHAWVALRMGVVSLDLPIAIGLAAAWGWSTVQVLLGGWHGLYFDSMTVLVFALRLGRFVQARAVDRAAARARLLAATLPRMVLTWREGGWQELPPEELRAGDRLRVGLGESVPCRSALEERAADFDLAVVNGESRPQQLAPGDEVPQGAVALDATVTLRALEAVDGQALAPAQPMGAGRAAVPMLADRIGAVFTAVVLLTAAAAFALQWPVVGAGRAIEIAMTVLIVACPCALGLATPVTVALMVAAAAREGVLVRDPGVIDRMHTLVAVALDKTGTLTEGRPEVVRARWAAQDPPEPSTGRTTWGVEAPPVGPNRELARALVDVEGATRHPLATALVAHLDRGEAGPELAPPQQVEVLPGQGVRGRSRGFELLALGLRASVDRALTLPDGAREVVDEMTGAGQTVVCLWARNLGPIEADGAAAPFELRALFGLTDRLRPDARATLSALRGKLGLRTVLLSGDHEAAVRRVAAELDLDDFAADVSPQDKRARLLALDPRGRVAMVGDGHNDVAALHAASVAVAVGSGTPSAIGASDAVLPASGVAGLLLLFERAARARRIIATTVGFALVYNAGAIALAATGHITPLVAALLMPVSSLTVVGWAIVASTRRTASHVSLKS